MTTIAVELPEGSYEPRELLQAGFDIDERGADAVIFAPAAPPATGARVAIAFLPYPSEKGYGFEFGVADVARQYAAVRADAYASSAHLLVPALRYALAEDRGARSSGPLRLTWLGLLGEPDPSRVEYGASYPIASSLLIGRADGCGVVLRQGPHSDQCSVARAHAEVARAAGGITVRDLGSSNGTYVRGERVPSVGVALTPGEEIAICGNLRLRLDGTP